MVDKNLFLHDLAIVAVLKCEGPYLKEWLDYHLLAGVNHFYLYDNESPDNQAEVAAPYVEAGLVDYIPAPGKLMQMPVYNDAIRDFKFFCRYMAFIDLDEFIYPKSNRGVTEVIDDILSSDSNAAGLAINWQIFGSNGEQVADYSRGVLERFTRRAPSDFDFNRHVKTISNPRKIHYIYNPHCAKYFEPLYPVNENAIAVRGGTPNAFNVPVTAEKIVINHYYIKSREEFMQKIQRGRCDDPNRNYSEDVFDQFDCNEIFDNGILTYRDVRAENFSLANNEQRFARVINALTKNLSLFANDTPPQNSLETALTCRALSTYLRKHFPDDADYWKVYEEASLAAILKSLSNVNFSDGQLFVHSLPEILRLPYPAVNAIRRAALQILPQIMELMRLNVMWGDWAEVHFIQDLLNFEES